MATLNFMSHFGLLTLALWACTVVVAAIVRNRQFATFLGVLLGIYSLLAAQLLAALAAALPVAVPAFVFFHIVVFVNFLALARPRMRPLWYRLLVSWPGSAFTAGTLLSLPWGILLALGFHPWAPWLPYLAALGGMIQSLTTRSDEIDLVVEGPGGSRIDVAAPHPHPRGDRREPRPLRIVQISDPHLGPFMSVARLRRICERAVKQNPDLIFLTGDFLTMESQSDPDLLLRALEPLKAMKGRVFACFGNHDHEAPRIVKRALASNDVTLLVDDACEIETDAGPVQIVGMDFTWRERKEHLARVCAEHPRKPGMTRIVMLHDPGAFKHLPEGEGDLVLSGHTHGGQVGLLSLGFSWTFLRLFGIKIPDHGFWARGTDRLYVHRGTGHYGFPLRLGVPAEESVIRIHRAAGAATGTT
ncbi:MAG: metallophosphoesterase [Polyangiaceae bacterium]